MARTKQTGKPKASATKKTVTNGTTKSPSAHAQSPAATGPGPSNQPVELSEQDRSLVKTWLDNPATDFKIVTAPLSKKRKRGGGGGMQTQGDLFEERLNVQYEVRPRDKWECLRRYKKFTVGSESITTGQCILVKHDESEDQGIDYIGQWKAKVLEVRALDSEHVYIRVAWLNRPEDLKTGRKPYHGKYELIPTNQMDVIDAMAVNGPCDVVHWDENDDESPALPEDQFFWRQTYDYVGSKTFSDLRKICIDDAPVNPDEMILQCSSKDCRKWQHIRCMATEAAQQAGTLPPKIPTSPTPFAHIAADASSPKKPAKKKPKPNTNDSVMIRSNSLAQAKAGTSSIIAEVVIAGLPNGDGLTPAKHSYIQITDAEGEKSTKAVQCMFCGTKID